MVGYVYMGFGFWLWGFILGIEGFYVYLHDSIIYVYKVSLVAILWNEFCFILFFRIMIIFV